MSEMVIKWVKTARMKARRRTDVISERAKAVTLGNLVDTMPDIVTSMISKVGML